jgi:hypothetical protein
MGTDYTTLAPRQRVTGHTTSAGAIAAIPGHPMPRADEPADGDRQGATGTAQNSENTEVIAATR